MEQYIPKSALLAEIERLRALLPDANDCDCLQLEFARGQQDAFTDFEEFIRTLEVKEVNLDYIRKELDELIRFNKPAGDFGWGTLYNVATHFFKLGVNASNPLTWEDVKLIWTIGDEIPYMPEEDFFKELLKRFKERKENDIKRY